MRRAIEATMQRRILVNYRVDPEALAPIVPAGFRPVLVDGCGIGGICLIRLGDVRFAGLPASVGVTTENAAHRIAVEWDTAGGPKRGVYVPRRDTSSRLVALLGGRAFPGWHHRSDFDVWEHGDRFAVAVTEPGGELAVSVSARRSDGVMAGLAFGSVEAASAFFRDAPVGYAATPCAGVLDGVELATCGWAFEPLEVDEVRSAFFEDAERFPAGTVALDSAFLMAGIETVWTAVA